MADSTTGQGNLFKQPQKMGLIAGLLFFILLICTAPPEGLSLAGWRTAAVAGLMAIWWITEAIPIPATSLLPLVLFPLFDIIPVKDAASPYANPLIFLFMGGFIVALGMQRWNLHRRIALSIIKVIGMNPRAIVAGFMIASAFLSMWVSNTATTMMMLPIGLSVVELAMNAKDEEQDISDCNFCLTLLLGIAYACSIGGLGTLIGTPPNALLAAFLSETYDIQLGFAKWMMVGIPLVVIGLPIAFYTLTRIVYPIQMKRLPGGKEYIEQELERLGKITRPEKSVAIVFGGIAVLWILRPVLEKWIPGLNDASIAIFGSVLMFVIPVSWRRGEFLLTWKYAEKLPWGVLLLFGGGLSLASAISNTGLSTWIGSELSGVSNWPILLVVLLIATIVILLTELTSNTATAAAFLPIMASVAVSIGHDPMLLLIPSTVAASCAFMLPVATPPNAIVYGSGMISIPQMAKSGVVLNALFILIITLLTFTIASVVFQF